ncbi:MAG: ketoacyl-ACP synthase III [Bacteroidales bacterium]|nr:ketoacyl-ACP synthase III [Bacteroidales bacterium]
MQKPTAAITGIGSYVPEYILTNHELAETLDTTDEWIMTRIGIKERRILKEENEGTSFMGVRAVNNLLEKTNTKPEDIDLVICATVTPDHPFPATANIIADKAGIGNAFHFDLNAGCSGFLYALATGARYIESGMYKKVIIIGADKMSSIVDYTDRSVAPIFGDGAGAVMLEPNFDGLGIQDMILESDGVGRQFLHQKAGGSVEPPSIESVNGGRHYVFQDGQPVFKWAVSKMADVSVEIMNKHNLTADDIAYLVPHQANMRIISATAKRMGLDPKKVMINIEKYGNTTAGTLPLCIADYEHKLKKGDNLILSTFGAGFTWGSIYLKWAY